MLTQLCIRNFAILDQLELEFNHGMTAITGETGAGKSIAIDALGLALGSRADSGIIKQGHNRCEITASFDISKLKNVQKRLAELELDADDECILRRTISTSGGSRAYINGSTVPLLTVKQISHLLLDIHSQHQHQSLLSADTQRIILDNFGQHLKQAKTVEDIFHNWSSLKKQISQLKKENQERHSRIEFLEFQVNELNELNLKKQEWENLNQEQHRLANQEEIQTCLTYASDVLGNQQNALSNQLELVNQKLQSIVQFQPEIKSVIELLDSASININEAIGEIRHSFNAELESSQLEIIETRMADIHELSRKHRCEPENLWSLTEKMQLELDQLLNADETLVTLENALSEIENNYLSESEKLTKKRSTSAKKLKREVEKLLSQLGMENCQFNAVLKKNEKNLIQPHGMEKISFEISTNPGAPSKPLAKIASGGELSRISLALQVVTTSISNIPTLIFDEVDVGIGGAVAEVVGKLLNNLGSSKQIICITHQAQVAAQANQHWMVEKQNTKKDVSTKMTVLNSSEREIEIARMIGGINLTSATQKHAKEMLKNALQHNSDKKNKLKA